MTRTLRASRLTAAALIAAAAIGGVSACSNDDAAPSTETSESEEAVNPDITSEQQAFVDDLLATPLPQDEATALIEQAGYSWRLGTIDGEPQAVTMDYRIDRLTLTIDDGLVTDATWG